jgi:LPXTG-motif cell wall-anchored protein
MRAVLFASVCLAATAAALHGQRPQGAVLPQDITVGDVFQAAIRLELPSGAALSAPDTLVLPEDLEHAGRRSVRTDTVDGVRRVTLVYPLTAWRPGSFALPPVRLAVVSGDSTVELLAALPDFEVGSVLPADTAGIEPRPAKDVLGANRVWWPILLGLLLLALIAAALWYWWKRRRRAEEAPAAPVAAVPPREAALARLEALEAAGLLERGEAKPYYEALAETLRRYVAAVYPELGVDLTTSELSTRARAGGVPEALELVRILGAADLVKFARVRPPADAARQDLVAARGWIERVPAAAVERPEADQRRVA